MFECAKIPPRSTWKTGCHLPDHKAIISALKETYGKKSYQSRLSRWVDRLIPFDYEVKHVPGRSLGIIDSMSRQPTFEAPPPPSYDELFVIKSIQAFNNALNSIHVSGPTEVVPICTISNLAKFNQSKCLVTFQTKPITSLLKKRLTNH